MGPLGPPGSRPPLVYRKPLCWPLFFSSFILLTLPLSLPLMQLYAYDVQAYQHCRASDAAATARAMSIAMEALGPGCRLIGSASTPSILNLFGLAPASSWLN